jgi:hypothetical protein
MNHGHANNDKRPSGLMGHEAPAVFIAFVAGVFASSQCLAASDPPRPAALDRLTDIAPHISACMHAPHENDEITVRLSFNRSGALIGKPRIMFMKSSAGPDSEAELANALLAALHDCTPLPFTPGFGTAIAGTVMTIRFIRRPQTRDL